MSLREKSFRIRKRYGVSKAAISSWCAQFTKECQTLSQQEPTASNEAELMKENLRLKRELEEKNKELGLYSIVRCKSPSYRKGIPHKVFSNLLEQNFKAEERNQKWTTDFIYLTLKDGKKRYNCTIINLYDPSVVASITDRNITSDLAMRTLQKAMESQEIRKGSIVLHSDQGSQYTSKEFKKYCESIKVMQSMSKAGGPYGNAQMERYFNILKNEWINLHAYDTEEELYCSIEEFAYVWYNHVRPHSYNGYQTPFEARYGKEK